MKKLFPVCIFLQFFIPAANAQLVTYTPLNASFDNIITLRFNINFSQSAKAKQLLGNAQILFVWMGAGTSNANAFEYTPTAQTNFNAPVPGAALTNVAGNTWEITLNPKTYCNVPDGKVIAVLGLIIKNAEGTAQTETIILKPGLVQQLNTITVTSKKPFIEQQVDKTVVNVQADLNAIGSSAFEILQKAPGLNITADDVINMSGKAGVNVLIDNRPTQMSAKELANFLRSMPGSSIEKIELITNPSARFDAQGNAGIINIRLKKNKIKGTNGSITAGYTQNVHYRSNGALNINHRSGKINAFANLGVDNNKQFTNGYINRYVTTGNTTSLFSNTTTDQDANAAFNIRTGIDYYHNKKNTFGFLFNGNGNRSPFNTPGQTIISTNGITDSSLRTQNNNLYKNKRYSFNLNYRYEDTLGNELNVDGDYTWFNNTNNTNLLTGYFNKNNFLYRNTTNNLDVATTINIYAIKADYVKQLKKISSKLQAGIKTSYVATGNNLMANFLAGATYKADTGRSNIFNYNENIYAAYFNFGSQIKKWEYQLGLRAENAYIKGKSTDLKKQQINNPDTSYLNFFPSLFISYTVTEKNKIAFSFSRRINRPDYQLLNPFETIFDIYTSEKGNPYLRPQYTNNFELKYTYHNAVNFALGYNRTKDYSQTITTQTAKITTATTSNIGMLNNTYLNISAPLPINKWWDGYVNLTGFINHYKGVIPAGNINNKVFGFNYYIQQNFNLGKGWGTQLSSWYNAPTTEAIFKSSSLGSLDWAIKKSILKNMANIRLVVNDVFNTQRWRQQVQFGNMNFEYNRKWESRGVRLQFTCNFGKTKFEARERNTNSDADRIKVKS
jgi:iron complex outermembrane recepter protein